MSTSSKVDPKNLQEVSHPKLPPIQQYSFATSPSSLPPPPPPPKEKNGTDLISTGRNNENTKSSILGKRKRSDDSLKLPSIQQLVVNNGGSSSIIKNKMSTSQTLGEPPLKRFKTGENSSIAITKRVTQRRNNNHIPPPPPPPPNMTTSGMYHPMHHHHSHHHPQLHHQLHQISQLPHPPTLIHQPPPPPPPPPLNTNSSSRGHTTNPLYLNTFATSHRHPAHLTPHLSHHGITMGGTGVEYSYQFPYKMSLSPQFLKTRSPTNGINVKRMGKRSSSTTSKQVRSSNISTKNLDLVKRGRGGGSGENGRRGAVVNLEESGVSGESISENGAGNNQATVTGNGGTEKHVLGKNFIISLIEGLISNPRKKLLGGRGNKNAIKRHLVEISVNKLLTAGYGEKEVKNFEVVVQLYGYKTRSPAKLEEDYLAELDRSFLYGEDSFASDKKTTSFGEEDLSRNRVISFHELVIQHSSHNHGQKLFLRFALVDANGERLDFVDTVKFKTITRRGIEKQRQKKNSISRDNSKERASIIRIDPACGIGDQTVILHCMNLPKINDEREVAIFFNNVRVNKIYGYRRPDLIVCRTPKMNFLGATKVSLTIHNKLMKGNVVFTYLDLTREDHRIFCIQNLPRQVQTGSNGSYNFYQSNVISTSSNQVSAPPPPPPPPPTEKTPDNSDLLMRNTIISYHSIKELPGAKEKKE